MAEQQHADERTDEQGGAGKALKRRGILTAAGVAVAGIMAKQAAQPVAATSGAGTDGTFVLGSNDVNNASNYASVRTQLVSGLTFRGPVLLDCSSSPFQSSGDPNVVGISGTSRGTAAGLYGSDSVGSKPSGYPAGLLAGVYGYTSTQGHSGVRGDGGSNGIGVSGISTNSNAVLGTTLGSAFNANAAVLGLGYTVAVEGDVPAGQSVANTIAVKGINQSTGANGIGVYGQCDAVGGYGVVGATDTPSSIGIGGMASADGSSAFSGGTNNPNAYAGYFQGHVVVAGSFDVAPLGNKHGVAPHPDGTHRTFYSVESPECWVEDFGTGTLTGGKAEIKLDADFAALVHTDDYHIFLAGVDEHYHLIAKGKTAKGFTVEADGELAKLKGKSTAELAGTFSYQVVAKPKTTATVERLAKATLPNLPLPPVRPSPAPLTAPDNGQPRKP